MLLRYSFDIVDLRTQRVSYGDFELRDVMRNCDTVTFHTVVYLIYHDQNTVSSINLTFRKNIIKKLES